MHVIIPAAGYATRLYPLTKDRPKGLLEVKGKPIIEHIANRVCELPNIEKISLVTNAKYYENFKQWAEGFECNVPLNVLNDGTTSNEDRKGQVGDILFTIEQEKVDSDLLIVAGDNIFNFSLKPCHDFFREKNGIVNAFWDSRNKETASQQGTAVVDAENKITEFLEKSPDPKSTYVSLGIYFFPKDKLELFKKFAEEGNDADKMGYFMIWLIENGKPYGFVYKEKWFDIGWHSALERARNEFVP